MNPQQEIMSVCLAVVRGQISPDQARAAILARTSPDPLPETLRLDPAILREAEQFARLPERDREGCLELFKELYDSTPGAKVLEEDAAFGRTLIEQRIVSRARVEECGDVQRRLHAAGCSPLPRLGELLLRKGFLLPAQAELAPTRKVPTTHGAGAPGPGGRQPPEEVKLALADPASRFGRYVRVSLLGEGGAGEVWKSWDSVLERWVALKFLKFEDTEELARLKREAQTAARLSHPHIAAVFEMAEANGRTFLVMEFIDGQTLATYPRNDHRRLVSLMREVALAIQYAHDQGVIHRDIKPGNIMVDTSGRPFIMDFGLARQIGSDHTTGDLVLGTPSYMSPEQARGGIVDARSDVYALGATLYELLADRPPFRGRNALETLDQVVRDEPRPLHQSASDLQTIVSKCLMKEPSRRYPRAADVAEEIRRWQDGEAIVAHPPSVLYRIGKKLAKRRAVLAVGLAGGLLSAVVGAWALRAGLELSVEKQSRAAEAKSLALARPHLDEGRRARKRLDRLLMTEDAPPETVRSLTEKARAEIDKALELYPTYPDALLEKARMFTTDRERDVESALEYFTKAIDATTGYTTAYLSRAKIFLDRFEERRHADEDTTALAERIRSDLKQVDAWSKDTEELSFSTAARAVLDGDYEKAARIFEEYATASVSSTRGWEWAGHSWLHVPGMHDKAVHDFSEAIRFKPRLASCRVWRGRAWLEAARARGGEPERAQAAADFRHALELEPSTIDALLGLGEVSLLAGDPAEAMLNFTRAVDSSPGQAPALLARARANLRLRDPQAALADAGEALRRGSRDPAALVARGRARCETGDIGGAQADFEDAAAKHPRFAPALSGLGDVLRERGTPERAVAEYDRALALDPGFAHAYRQRGNAERERGRLDKALADLDKAISMDASDPFLYFDRGAVFCDQGAWVRAQEEFRKGLALRPTRPDWFQQRLWLARSKAGEAAAALEDLRTFVKERPAGTAGRLAPKINDLLLGSLSEEEFISLLERTEFSRPAIAEGYFFAGEKALIEGRTARAEELLRRCLRTGALTTAGYSTAAVELRSLSK